MPDEPHLPSPSLWPIGFAIGIAVILVGLIIDPLLISSIGGVIALLFGVLWARDATSELRGRPVVVTPEHRQPSPASALEPALSENRFPRNKFLEASTIGLGAVIGGMITVPIAGFAVLPGFVGQKRHKVDLGPLSDFASGQWYIATFTVDPK
jgi:hypothetical protein